MDRVFAFSLLGYVGRLGNQLWQVAATLDFAERDPDARPAIPADWEYRDFVNLPPGYYRAPERTEEVVDVARLPEGPYFQSLEHIEAIGPKLPHLFGSSAFGEERWAAHRGPVPFGDSQHFTAALHVRRTDYLENPDRFPTMTSAYYQASVKHVLSNHPDTVFKIFSDDIEWCRENREYLGLTDVACEFIGGHVRPIPPRDRIGEPADIFDLWLMSRCNAFILANSTFSWWGAYLSGSEEVIYPDRWFGEDAQHSEKQWGAFKPEWTQISC